MTSKAEDLMAALQAELPRALESGQLVAYFQPEVELPSGRVVAAESLARWEHPELGTLAPALFIPLAEKLGLIGELTQLMLRLSLRQQRAWAAEGRSIPVSVNAAPEVRDRSRIPGRHRQLPAQRGRAWSHARP